MRQILFVLSCLLFVVLAQNCVSTSRVDCGFVGITQQQCEAKGCCYSPASNGDPWCFNSVDLSNPILTVVAYYPDDKAGSSSLSLRGSLCSLSWNSSLPMKKVSANKWSVSLYCPAKGVLEFKTMLGSRWQLGANTMASLNNLVNGSHVDAYPWFFSTQGEYHIGVKNLWSPQLNNSRNIVIYTPPSYHENTLKTITNVLVMHDGQNLFNPATAFGGVAWMCQDTVNSQVIQGNMEEILIIGVYNTADRIDEYTYSVDPGYGGGKGDIYLDFLQQTVLPWAQGTYRISTGVANLGILGSSLGGLISCYAGWTRSNIYSKTGCMSSSFWWNDEDFNGIIMVNYSRPPKETFYLDSGGLPSTGGDGYEETIRVRDHMEALGFQIDNDLFYYWDKNGRHSESYWGARFYVPMGDLYPPSTLSPSL